MKVSGPMMSMSASGTIGGLVTASIWKGRPYFRLRVTPSNPKSAGQTSTRAMFRFLSQQWASLTSLNQATWDDLAAADNVTPFNAFMRANQRTWTQFATPTQAYPAAGTDTPCGATIDSVTAGVKQATLSITTDDVGTSNWGVLIMRSTTTGFTPTSTNLVGVLAIGNDQTKTYTDTPLEAGTYYYKAIPFTVDGVKGAASAQQTVVIS